MEGPGDRRLRKISLAGWPWSYSSVGGGFICWGWSGGLAARSATRQLRRRSPRHEQEVKENVLARPGADARRVRPLSFALALSLPPFQQPLFLQLAAAPIPLPIHHLYTYPSGPASAILRLHLRRLHARLCNIHSTILFAYIENCRLTYPGVVTSVHPAFRCAGTRARA